MHLCNMLIYLLILSVLNCVVLSETANMLCMLSLHISKYFVFMRGQRITLTSDCQVSADPPRSGMFAGQSDRKSPKVNPPNRPRRGGSYVCLCCPVYAVNCDSAVSCDAHKSCYESTMIHKLAYFLSNEVANVLAGTILNADFKSTLAMSAPFPNADNM